MTAQRRPLAAVYAFFALAAGARGVVQSALAPGTSPVAHGLTLLAAGLYLVGAVALHRGHVRTLRTAMTIELTGVLVVGALSFTAPALLGGATVWSRFGVDYGGLPLALPLIGLALTAPARRRRAIG